VSELVARLRRSGVRHADSLENEAAGRIEALERENAALDSLVDGKSIVIRDHWNRIEELELALREAVEEFREMDEPMVAERYRAVLKKKS
jgi:uncharacterized coiled-coil protein SlyX